MADKRAAWIAGAAVTVLAAYAIVTPLAHPIDEAVTDFAAGDRGPGAGNWFGTDASGRDLFTLVAMGMRVSLGISLATAVLSTIVGLFVGVTAGAFGGWWDRIGMRVADAMTAIPSLLLSLLIVTLFRGSLVAIVVSLVLTHWTATARVVRAELLSLRDAEYVQVARLRGLPGARIARIHFLPVAAGQAGVAAVLLVAHAVWHESTLSFLGVGLPPHQASLGTLLAESGEALLLGHWWRLVFPAGAIVAVTLALSALGRSLTRRPEVMA
ncbi:ABC transporter permease [Amycolatopsis sp. BJA-103]|uniref:ABC transporter permease n=1 Tax=unclassified Amycolatopsis TaxID=2618356 RepID=UPI000C76D166|nr:ABC transporter permease [Amycolatopsis sp. BJA-103]AUI61032.1 ABC transporter permease [Amycolatopsis sp. BJA-103]PNE21683.1 ABC transporter permease [Amycolatopsis sp. BJA-103]